MDRMKFENELDKISNFYINNKNIKTADILKLTNTSENLSISELPDMCLSK